MKKSKKAVKPAKHRKASKPAASVKLAKTAKEIKPKKAQTAKSSKSSKPAKSRNSSKSKVLCEFCGLAIPAERLEILPDTTTCVQCSQTQPYSEAEILGMDGTDEQDKNRLNVEDFDEPDTDISVPYNESW